METENFIHEKEKEIMSKVKYLDLQEMIDGGYLQEVNRQFFHPLGLALEVKMTETVKQDSDTVLKTTYQLSGIWDCRNDPEGVNYSGLDDTSAKEKAAKIAKELEVRAKSRQESLGYIIQPIEGLSDANEKSAI